MLPTTFYGNQKQPLKWVIQLLTICSGHWMLTAHFRCRQGPWPSSSPFWFGNGANLPQGAELTRDFCLWKFGGTIHGNTYSTICICICISIVYIYIYYWYIYTYIYCIFTYSNINALKIKVYQAVTSGCTLNPAICTCHFRQVVGNVDWKMHTQMLYVWHIYLHLPPNLQNCR